VLDLLRNSKQEVTNLGGLARGLRFGDIEVGRRIFNHNSGLYYANTDYYIHQWKTTNDLTREHPQGSHFVSKSFPEFLNRLKLVIEDQNKRYR